MQKRKLGGTGLEVAVLGYGAGALGGAPVPAAAGRGGGDLSRLLNRMLDAGVNYIDTAPDYGNSEEIIGRALSRRRASFFLATKCGCPDRDWRGAHVWTAGRLLSNIESSLRRLKTTYVDVWQLHNPVPGAVRQGELLEVMERVRRQGKVRYVGVSTTLPDIVTYMGWGVFDAFQLPYSGLNRRHENVMAEAAAAGAGVIVRGSVAEGEPRRGLARDEYWRYWAAAGLDELRGSGESRTMFLLRFALSHPGLHTALVATGKMAHFEENLRAAEAGPLPADVYAEAKRRLDGAGQKAARAGRGLKRPGRQAPAAQ